MKASKLLSGFSFGLMSIILIGPLTLRAQEDQQDVRYLDAIDTLAHIFEAENPMEITLTLDLKKFQKEKMKGEYMPVQVLYQLNDTLRLEKEMRMKARGKTRRKICSLPPFWLDIQNADIQNNDIQDEEQEDIKKVKFVTHCKDNRTYEEYVLKEYLCYKIYNIISPISFRVRLARMIYVDTGRDNKVMEGWAFIIEPIEMLAQRFNATKTKTEGLLSRQMRPMEMNRLALFQYMIGNPDYSVPHSHNVKILEQAGMGAGRYTAVPYDFDYSGLVDAYYAIPSEYLDITSVKERYYLGPCRSDMDFALAIEQLNLYREEILQLVGEFDYLDEKVKKSLLSYLEEYFEEAEHQTSLIFGFQRTCL